MRSIKRRSKPRALSLPFDQVCNEGRPQRARVADQDRERVGPAKPGQRMQQLMLSRDPVVGLEAEGLNQVEPRLDQRSSNVRQLLLSA